MQRRNTGETRARAESCEQADVIGLLQGLVPEGVTPQGRRLT